jgi:CheY-like chemotaxis protein
MQRCAKDVGVLTPQAGCCRKKEISMPSIAEMPPRPTLLLVDDCVAERNFYEMALETEFNILIANHGSDGVNVALSEHPDLVLLDVKMPGMDGWTTCTFIKSHPDTADIPVVLLTGTDDIDLTQHAVAVGASALLIKPCPAEKLRNTIRQALDTKYAA